MNIQQILLSAIAGAIISSTFALLIQHYILVVKPRRNRIERILSEYEISDLTPILPIDGVFIRDRKKAYEIAGKMLLSKSRNILNVGATLSLEDTQVPFFLLMEKAVRSHPHTDFTRLFTMESDKSLRWTKWLLEHLGQYRNLEIKMIKLGLSIPSCVVADSGAILGFNDDDSYRLKTAMYFQKPDELIDDIRTYFQFRFESGKQKIVKIKSFDEKIQHDEIEERLYEIRNHCDVH